MKKILVVLATVAIILQTNFVSAGHLPEPEISISDTDKFSETEIAQESCGYKHSSFYYDAQGNAWGRHVVISGSKQATALMSERLDGQKLFWVYRHVDEHPDEYYVEHKVFLAKYPTPCSLIGINK